jgi:hypothetical protein
MNLDEDLGWGVVPHEDDVPRSSLALTPPNRGSFLLKRGVQENVAVVVGKILSPSSHLPRPRSDAEQQVGIGIGVGATATATANANAPAIIHIDAMPRKPRRDPSEHARWEAATSHSGAGSGRHCDPQQARNSIFQDLTGKFNGSPSPCIEVAPGVKMRLRGSHETWIAISQDLYVPGFCWGCLETIFVIQDAAYVLCPACRTVSPMDGTFERPDVSGVGLGFTFDDLVLWQQQITDERNRKLYN